MRAKPSLVGTHPPTASYEYEHLVRHTLAPLVVCWVLREDRGMWDLLLRRQRLGCNGFVLSIVDHTARLCS